jgi:hypothetical protein
VGRTGRRRLVVWGVSAAAHGLVILARVAAPSPAPPPMEAPEPLAVALVTPPPKPPEPPTPAPKPKPAPPKAAPKAAPPVKRIPVRRPVQVQAPVAPLVVAAGPSSEGEVSDAELSGAARAGSGSGAGAGCDMARRLQAALRKDPRVRTALAEAGDGRALRVWNGDWVRHPGQEGNGLAAVREAIIWEVGFSPEPCRREPVRGLVLLSLADGPGGARIVMGAGAWRWSDLLSRKR